jgi:hypothetical protein
MAEENCAKTLWSFVSERPKKHTYKMDLHCIKIENSRCAVYFIKFFWVHSKMFHVDRRMCLPHDTFRRKKAHEVHHNSVDFFFSTDLGTSVTLHIRARKKTDFAGGIAARLDLNGRTSRAAARGAKTSLE